MRTNARLLCCAIASSLLTFGALAANAADPRLDTELIDADVNAAKGNALIQVPVRATARATCTIAWTTAR
jgi:hypothetical protein